MRIDEMRGFFSRIAPGSAPAKSNAASSVLHVPLQQQQNDDSLMLSKTGKLLGLHVKTSPSLTGEQKIGTDKAQKLPEWAQRVDKNLSKAINIFERMHELATEAQDETLTDLERVDMQIEIEGLRTNLVAMALPMALDTDSLPTSIPTYPNLFLPDGDYRYGDYSSVLGRMKTRIINGEEWDVREAFAPEGFTRTTYDENGEEVTEAFAAEAWYVVGDENILTSTSNSKIENSGRNVPTVSEILAKTYPVVVMDTESAANGAKYLENQIASVQEWREHLATNFDEPFMKEKSASFFHNIAIPDGVIRDSLTDPTIANAFLFSEGIGDIRYFFNRSTPLEYREGADISLNENENIEDGSKFINNGEAVKVPVPNLNGDPTIGNVPIEERKRPKIVEIKGISQKRK